jgi:hypothetical protein
VSNSKAVSSFFRSFSRRKGRRDCSSRLTALLHPSSVSLSTQRLRWATLCSHRRCCDFKHLPSVLQFLPNSLPFSHPSFLSFSTFTALVSPLTTHSTPRYQLTRFPALFSDPSSSSTLSGLSPSVHLRSRCARSHAPLRALADTPNLPRLCFTPFPLIFASPSLRLPLTLSTPTLRSATPAHSPHINLTLPLPRHVPFAHPSLPFSFPPSFAHLLPLAALLRRPFHRTTDLSST